MMVMLHPLDTAHSKYSRVEQKVLSLPFLQTIIHTLAKWLLEFLGIPRIFLGIPRNLFLGIPRNKGVNFHGKFGLGIPRNS